MVGAPLVNDSSTSLTTGLVLLVSLVARNANRGRNTVEPRRAANEILLLVKRTVLLAALTLALKILIVLPLGSCEQGLALLGVHGHDLRLL